jgi:O-acetyl-ADP-ribose deacetylase (regulator of RNase III)
MAMPRLHLVDTETAIVDAWREAFAARPEVDIVHGDILAVAHGALVSPANSLGHMDGGIDLLYLRHFGAHLQLVVYDAIGKRPHGVLPVGAAEMVRTGHARIPYLVIAPTMDIPEVVAPAHAYRAMRAILRTVRRHAGLVDDVFCPGLATGIGKVAPADAAREMARAYEDDLARA